MRALNLTVKSSGLQMVNFILVGGATALLYFGVIAVGTELLRFNYLYCVSFAYILSVGFHFLANRRFTFRATKRNTKGQLAKYAALLGINYAITIAVVFLCVDHLGFSTYLASGTAVGVTMGTGFVILRFWVFAHRERDHEH
jgi:putative flippase GtrA